MGDELMTSKPILGILFFIVTACGQNKFAPIAKKQEGDTAIKGTQKSVDSIPPNTPNRLQTSIGQFILPGYSVLDTATGDLNLDPYADMILVLKKNGEDTSSDVVDHPEKRPLLILLGQLDQSYKLAGRNNDAVYCVDCGGMMGDPFMDVIIKNGYFSIEHYGGSSWRWARTVTFKYSRGDDYWFLFKDGGDSFHASDPEKVETKIKTATDFGKIAFDKFDIYKE